jgi:DNA-binding XRE family transcriptional regulator
MPDRFRPVKTKLYMFFKFAVERVAMISTAQIRAARGLLKWTQATVAHRASLSTVTLNMIENEAVRPRESTLKTLQTALEAGGVEFLSEDGIGVGVRFCPKSLMRCQPDAVPQPQTLKLGLKSIR